jgi:hypothetical protein
MFQAGRRRTRLLAVLALACVCLAGGTRCGGSGGLPDVEAITLPGFLIGVSQGGAASIPIATDLGVRWMRTQVTWRQVEPTLADATLTVADVDANPQLVSDYIANGDWAWSDAMLAQMLAAGLSPLVIVGHGYTTTLPTIGGDRATPDRIGREQYLGHIYLLARATVERYDGDGVDDAPGGQVVKFWQLENELNQAFFTAVWGWREPSYQAALGSAWEDWGFVTELLETLSRAVRMEDPDAWTTVNFHSDVPGSFNSLFNLPSWQASIGEWLYLVDIVGFDAYPNYYRAEPVDGQVVGERIAEAVAAARGKPVVIIETGYPSGPAERGYSEASQALYIQESYETAVAAGAQGYFLFGTKTGESHGVEITAFDLAEIEKLATWFDEGRVLDLLAYANDNAAYIENHLVDVLQSVEPYWGLVRQDGSHKAGWDVFAAIAASVP